MEREIQIYKTLLRKKERKKKHPQKQSERSSLDVVCVDVFGTLEFRSETTNTSTSASVKLSSNKTFNCFYQLSIGRNRL